MFDPENKTWCATKVDNKGIAVKGHWGDCHETCPLDINGTSNLIGFLFKVLLGRKFHPKSILS